VRIHHARATGLFDQRDARQDLVNSANSRLEIYPQHLGIHGQKMGKDVGRADRPPGYGCDGRPSLIFAI
jgi:hypothetical protein